MSQDKLLGFEDITSRFATGLQEKRLHHAWLFYGVKGIGKAKLARALSEMYFCESPDFVHNQACGQCHACAMMYAESHPDFMRMELMLNPKTKKMNRDINIEQTREALGFLSLSGLKSQQRVVLIDGADLMNNQSANALLKGLEEPTPGSLLMIVCHDVMRLPATVRSRCMLQACAPLNAEDMEQVLNHQGLHQDLHDLAIDLGQGSPGSVSVLCDAEIAKALLAWQQILKDLYKSDIGELQAWLDKYVNKVPHNLIASMVIIAMQKNTVEKNMENPAWEKADDIYQAAMAVASWPKEVLRHSLRPAPALLSYILRFRMALKS